MTQLPSGSKELPLIRLPAPSPREDGEKVGWGADVRIEPVGGQAP
jgi:hypothetical protein